MSTLLMACLTRYSLRDIHGAGFCQLVQASALRAPQALQSRELQAGVAFGMGGPSKRAGPVRHIQVSRALQICSWSPWLLCPPLWGCKSLHTGLVGWGVATSSSQPIRRSAPEGRCRWQTVRSMVRPVFIYRRWGHGLSSYRAWVGWTEPQVSADGRCGAERGPLGSSARLK